MIARIAILFVLATSLLQSQNDESDSSNAANSGIIYGKDHAFGLTAPAGWILDNSSGVSVGLHAVFYPKGGSWEHSRTVMYANTANRESNGGRLGLISFDSTQFLTNHPQVVIRELPPVVSENGDTALVREFFYSQYEAVAYFEEETVIVMLVLSARSEKEYRQSLPAFRELAASYAFLTTEVTIE